MRIPLILAALVLAMPASAQDCELSASTPTQTVVTPAGTFYYHFTPCPGECSSPHAVYEESNGYAGLQRNDDIVDDTCGGAFPSDTLIIIFGF